MRFLEIILNPSNAPMFFFKLIKKLDREDKDVVSRIYESFGLLEVEVISLDLKYNEEREAMFIKKVFEIFNKEIKEILLKITEKLVNGEDFQIKENNGSYFG
ncbi:hypothetical protein GF396_02695 [Candidatus Pacearchaeota archaeon]|nr:hypothetical protein [Candidatus Pacearchaeota archaeon]